jgi:hypothetical protein
MTTGILTETRLNNFWAKVDKTSSTAGCWLWTGAKQGGRRGKYGAFQMGWKIQKRAHRLSFEIANGPIPDGMMVCHSCDTPLCVNPAHLFLGTAKDNVDDMSAKNRKVNSIGEKNGASKLTADAARSIYTDPRTNREIAQDYNISSELISQIRHRKIWADATADLPVQLKRKPGAGSPGYKYRLARRLPNSTLQAVTQ